MAFAFYFLLLIIPSSVTSLKFNFSKIVTEHQNVNITTYPDAYISPDGLQVTSDARNSALNGRGGKAIYVKPLHLWDKSTQQLTTFNTHFTFVINSQGRPNFADGMTFFLHPTGEHNIALGGAIGLPVNQDTWLPNTPFVAVEFDTFRNNFSDPLDITPRTHVGINVNSLISNVTKVWYSNITGGITNECWINYDSGSTNLSVVYTGVRNGINITSGIYLVIDLREILPEKVSFGFSASTGADFETHTIKSWDFSSSLEIPDEMENPKTAPTGQPGEPIPGGEKKKNKAPLVIGLVICSCVLVGGLAFLGVFFWRRSQRRRKEDEDEDDGGDDFEHDMTMENEFEMGSGPKKFSYSALRSATNEFSEDQMLGKGGFGGVYRGFIKETNTNIAVKKISKGSKQGMKEYASEVRIISRLRHRNLVQLIGWCHERRELLLVYEYMENASLDFHLFKERSMLTWPVRFKIAQGLASALLYLHEEWEQCVVHRDIKSSNVMLDSNFNAKLGDFGLARFVDHEKGSQTTVLAGTMGYMAPECMITGKASKETDVYSLGVVLLEIACGRKPFELKFAQNQVRMVEWVWGLYGIGKLLEAADSKLGQDFDQQEMTRLMIVGLWCAHPDYNTRPSIRQAIQVLNFEAPLPELPLTMPVPTYFPPPLNAAMSNLLYSDSAFSMTSSQNQSSSYTYNTDSSNIVSSSTTSSPSTSLLYPKSD